jgi:hypothetical protein
MIICLLSGTFYALGGFSNFTKLTKGDRERVAGGVLAVDKADDESITDYGYQPGVGD